MDAMYLTSSHGPFTIVDGRRSKEMLVGQMTVHAHYIDTTETRFIPQKLIINIEIMTIYYHYFRQLTRHAFTKWPTK